MKPTYEQLERALAAFPPPSQVPNPAAYELAWRRAQQILMSGISPTPAVSEANAGA